MDSKSYGIWFLRGFLATTAILLVVTLLVVPNVGRAQGEENFGPNAVGLAEEPSHELASDMPGGENGVPFAGSDQRGTDPDLAASPNDFSHATGSDIPGKSANVAPVNIGQPFADPEAMLDQVEFSHLTAGNGIVEGVPTDLDQIGTSGDVSAQQVYTRPLVIPAADFRWEGTRDAGGQPDDFLLIHGYATGGPACLQAPAYLPGGYEVYQAWASVYDNEDGNDVRLYLYRVNVTNGALDTMASWSTDDAVDAIRDIADYTINTPNVVYPTYSYYLRACLDSRDTQLYSVRLWYR